MTGSDPHRPAGGADPDALRRLLAPALGAIGITLVECAWRGGRRGPLLALTVDRPGGITVDECGAASEAASQILDRIEAELPSRYSLEVSSPGAERPLLEEADYRSSLGRRVRVRLASGGPETVLEGRLVGVSRGALELEARRRSGRRQRFTVDRSRVTSARVVVDI